MLFLIVLLALHAAGCGSAGGGGTTWRFAIEEIQGSVQDAYAQEFKRLVEEDSGGRIGVTVYPYGTLGTSDQITEQLHLGAIQIATASPGHIGKLIPELQAFLLHYVLSEDPRVNRELIGGSTRLRQAMNDLYLRKDFRFLTLLPEGEQVWTTKRPVREPADFDGMKFRVMTSPVLLESYAAYGANPTPLPYAEVYSALQLSMIDGQVNPVFAIEEMSFYEVTDYLIFPGHSQSVTTVVANGRFLDSLDAKDRELLNRTVERLDDYIFKVQEEYNTARLQIIREKKSDVKVIRLTEQQRARFREKAGDVQARFGALAGPGGKQFLELLLQEVEAARRRVSARTEAPRVKNGRVY